MPRPSGLMSDGNVLAFFSEVQAALAARPGAFDRFLSVLSEGHPDLIARFQEFVLEGSDMPPPAKRIKLQPLKAPPPVPTPSAAAGMIEVRSSQFWDRVRQHLTDSAVYLEFLKLIQLYSHKVLNLPTFLHRARAFLGGSPDLWGILVSLISPLPSLEAEQINLSYHLLHNESERKAHCSGRDGLCHEVLNDDWVAHPHWSTDGESLEPFRRNDFEEHLFRTEEERHELDFYLSCIHRTIRFLESESNNLDFLSPDAKDKSTLSNQAKSASQAAYAAAIKKIYGAQHGPEVVDALYTRPSRVIPTLLARLRRKEIEWRETKAKWNLVWKEVEARSFPRSLDHQLSAFQASERKTLSSREMISEIEVRKAEHLRLLRDQKSHLWYDLEDRAVLLDATKLVFVLISHEWTMTKADVMKVKRLFCCLLARFFGLSADELSRLPSQGSVHWPQEGNGLRDPEWAGEAGRPLFSTTKLYLLIRLLHLVYARLLKFKVLATKTNSVEIAQRVRSQDYPDKELLPSLIFQGYDIILNLSERWLTGCLDEGQFLDSVRFLFPLDAYVLSTLDRVLWHVARAAQAVVADTTSMSLLSLAWQEIKPKDNAKQALALAADSNAGHIFFLSFENSRLGITLLSESQESEDDARKDPVGLLGPIDLNEEGWLAYVRHYASFAPTVSAVKPPFLRRNVRKVQSCQSDAGVLVGDRLGTRYIHRSDLVFRIALQSLRLFFEPGSEDVFVRLRPTLPEQAESNLGKEHERGMPLTAHLASKSP